MALCSAFDPAGPYIRGLVSYIDCQSLALSEQGYRALGAGSPFATALDGLLTLAVAMFSYNLLLGAALTLRDGMLTVLRIGLVLTLALHWSAYQPLVYNVATRGPQELLGRLFAGSGTGADNGAGLIERVQAVDTTLGAILHPEREQAAPPPSANNAGPAATLSTAITPTTPFGQTPELAPETRELLGSADRVATISVLAGLVSLRIVTALLLALAPFFIAALLFEAARGLFAGWLRVILGALLGSVAVPTVIALELAVLEPQVLALRRLFESGQALGGLPERLWITSGLFALVMAGVLFTVMRAAYAIRFPDAMRREFQHMLEMRFVPNGAAPLAVLAHQSQIAARGHAQRIADAALAIERRDHVAGQPPQGSRIAGPHSEVSARTVAAAVHTRLGQAGRETGRRQSAAASRRDQE